ncbi:hypothetical protein EA252_17625 [Escherichia coli]|uniref:Uncharacterized protein n=1 Tax=Escherichia coli TaxID=562 RepID=A0A641J324_ECOLX|nr:phage tail protein [Escherichia coli]KAA2182303.1 hypothetical protein EA252_17625 [Escherichia coli]
MGADKTNNIMTLSSGVSQSLLADVQYFELYSSLALNRKLKNIVLPGFYCGFEPVPGTGLSVRITSENSEGKGAASVDVNNVQISVQQIEDVTVSVKAGATNIIVLEANFEHGVKTTQVDSASSVSAARIYARTDNTIGQNQIELCRVIVPSGATAVTKEMIVLKYRVNRAVGVEFSNEISSTEERKAATPKAVKAAYDLANGKYTAQDATTTQKGIVQLSSDTNSTSETLAATPKAVKAAYDLAAGKAPSNHIHPWNQITGVPTASLTAKGITQLSSATNSTSEVLAATPKAVKAAYDLAKPAGWLKCDGRAFTKEQYPVLARVYPTLRLPDLRGEFIRGWDDGRKVDTGRALLSFQEGTIVSGFDDNDTGDISSLGSTQYGFGDALTSNQLGVINGKKWIFDASSKGAQRYDWWAYVSARPRNIAFNYIVRAA